MTVTPSQILTARPVPLAEGQLDLFAAATDSHETAVPAAPERNDRAAADTDTDACPADCPCHWMTADTTDRSATDPERTDR